MWYEGVFINDWEGTEIWFKCPELLTVKRAAISFVYFLRNVLVYCFLHWDAIMLYSGIDCILFSSFQLLLNLPAGDLGLPTVIKM